MKGITRVGAVCVFSMGMVSTAIHADDLRLVETSRIGELEGADEYLFGIIAAIAVGPDGCIYVADRQQVSIRRFTKDGIFDRYVGRAGEGPGEYRDIAGMKCLPDGQLVVLARGPSRLAVFNSAGSLLSDVSLQTTLHAPGMLEYDLSNNLYVKDVKGHGEPGEEMFVYEKRSIAGDLLGSVTLPKANAAGKLFWIQTSEGALAPFTVMSCHAWSPQRYFVVGRNDRYDLELQTVDGAVVRRFSRKFERVPVGREEHKQWEEWRSKFSEGVPGSPPTKYPPIPSLKPVFRAINVGEDGRIWVLRHVVAEDRKLPPRAPGDSRPSFNWREPSTFDGFEPDGTFLGAVVLPRDAFVHVWRGNEAWGSVVSEDGPQVVRYRIDGLNR